ncbi:vWA domain-containing protein [Paludifilum halophilum]|nr:VWA domain-containing protein [Paludifilum halophilum]
MNRAFLAALFSGCLILTSGCSGLIQQSQGEDPSKKEQKTSESNSDEEKESFANLEIPSQLEDLRIREGAGKYGGKQYDLNNIRPALDKLPKDLSSEELFQRLLKLMAEDYRPSVHFFENYDPSIIDIEDGPGEIRNLQVPKEEEVNIVVLLDSSGSMAAKVKGGKKMDLAKESVRDFVSNMPQGANVSLQVYGHKGSNSKKDKKISCESTEEIYPLGEYKEKAFKKALKPVKPAGWTPLAASMEKAKQTLESHQGDHVQNIIYVVSDGVETCDGDPVQAAENLHESNIKAVVNMIGFDVDDEGQKALKNVADAGGGSYKTVDSEVGLAEYFEAEYSRLYDEWGEWASDHYDKAQVIGSNKYDELQSRGSDLYHLAQMESKHLYDAVNYLKEERDYEYNVISDVKSSIYDRKKAIQGYTSDSRRSLQEEVSDNRREIQDQVTNKRRSKQDEILDQKNN